MSTPGTGVVVERITCPDNWRSYEHIRTRGGKLGTMLAGASYRDSTPRCPRCGGGMRESEAGDGVQICPSCHGLWVDWFAGDLPDVASRAKPLPPTPADDERSSGEHACPSCNAHLHSEAYGARDGHEISEGIEVMRCGTCAGVYVDRSSFDALAAMAEWEQPGGVLRVLLRRLLAWLWP